MTLISLISGFRTETRLMGHFVTYYPVSLVCMQFSTKTTFDCRLNCYNNHSALITSRIPEI